MSKKLGMKVLHPGGLQATELIAEKVEISKDMVILDAGCGSGSSSILLAKKYGCRVVGIDFNPNSLIKAHEKSRRKNLLDRVSFKLADLNSLSLQDNIFDGAIFQASLIFCEKTRVLHAISQKIRPGGFLGVVELAWKLQPPTEILAKVKNVLCSAVANAECHNNWKLLFEDQGLVVESSAIHDLDFSFPSMLTNEGFFSSLRIALKCIFKQEARNKIRAITNLFNQTGAYLGYGIYVCRKPVS